MNGDQFLIQVESLVKKIPERFFSLNKLMESPEFCLTDSDIKKYILKSTSVLMKEDNNSNNSEGKTAGKIELGINKPISDAIDILKPHVHELINDANALAMWILLNIPKINCDNNDVYDQKGNAADFKKFVINGNLFFKKLSTYSEIRAKFVVKILKYPTVEDYRQLIIEIDCFYYCSIVKYLKEVRDSYFLFREYFIENKNKIESPEASNTYII